MRIKQKKNFLDFVPVRNPDYIWELDKKGGVSVCVVNKGFYNFLAQRLFKRPRNSAIMLDEYGSYIWQQIDGKNTIFDIAAAMKQQFGKEAEPLYDRLAKYFQTLNQNKFINYEKEEKKRYRTCQASE